MTNTITQQFLYPNGSIPKDALSPYKLQSIINCQSNPKYYIRFNEGKYYPQIDATLFEMEVGVQLTPSADVNIYIGKLRYSQLKIISDIISEMVKDTHNNNLLEVLNEYPFPPKIWVNKNSNTNIENRRIQFNNYFSNMHKLGSSISWKILSLLGVNISI